MTVDTSTFSGHAMDLKLDRKRSMFVIMDVQERLVDAMPDECRSVAVDNIIRLIQGARILNLPLVLTEQYSQGLGPTIESVAHAVEELAIVPRPIDKLDFDGCADDRFLAALEEVNGVRSQARDTKAAIVLCGMEAHVCIYQTARSLIARGHAVHVPIDATCCRRIDNHRIAEQLLARAGAIITSTETVLFDLLGRGGGSEFKAISNLVR